MTVWETDVMPSQWRNILSHVLEVWLPCEFNVSVFSGALEAPIFKLPHPLFPPQGDDNSSDVPSWLTTTEHDFVFYSIFEWQERKCPLELLEAYLRAFPTETDTLLLIKTNPGAVSVARQAVEEVRQRVRSEARIEIRPEAWSEAHIAALHERGDCYVSLHRGEGWGYPLFEAASRGTPVIATGYAGPLDYLHPRAHYLVRYELRPVRQPYVYYHPDMRWAEPDLTHAAEQMRWVYANRESAREQAAEAAHSMQQSYSLEVVGALARERLRQLLKHTQPHNWERLDRSARIHQLRPVIPIPAGWYDEDYFEHGLKSNWDQGYTWPLFGGLFQETAAFLNSSFSEATSYLDIGCAKGFLIRTLHELGQECWGFDYSQWAIEHAEECARPFIMQASVDDISYDRQFDVLVALSIFESLTESQALSFLCRARAWTRQALFATIPSFQQEEEEFSRKDNHDLSHITIKSRQWWHELFLRAGWRQDYLHRVAERMFQAHSLPTKMGWKVYVYAPE
jgi:2-polyprenyl-3-methyl-5-hydroxy-6-metoxy-1,4-benzoquinol methylase